MRQTNAGFGRMPLTEIIRPTVGDGIRHLSEQPGIELSLAAHHATHVGPLRLSGCTRALFF